MRIEAAIGLTEQEMQRGRYALGEGVTGRVMASGEPQIIPDVSADPNFLNRTGAGARMDDDPMSFICVPVKDGKQNAGAISVHKPFVDDVSLEADSRLLAIKRAASHRPFASTIWYRLRRTVCWMRTSS